MPPQNSDRNLPATGAALPLDVPVHRRDPHHNLGRIRDYGLQFQWPTVALRQTVCPLSSPKEEKGSLRTTTTDSGEAKSFVEPG